MDADQSGEPFPGVAKHFSRAVRGRGERYARLHKVRIVEGGNAHIEARVRGTRLYDVFIDVEDSKVAVSCDCFYAESGAFCKHVWATLLVSARNGYLTDLHTGGEHQVAPLEGAEFEDHDLDDSDESTPAEIFGARSLPMSAQHPRKPPSWKDLMPDPHLAAYRPSVPPDREIFYWMDPNEIRTGERVLLRVGLRKKLKNGDWQQLSFRLDHHSDLSWITNRDDAYILGLITTPHDPWRYGGFGSETVLAPTYPQLEAALPVLGRTGRFFVKQPGKEILDLPPAAWDENGWEVRYNLHPAQGDTWEVTGRFERGQEIMDLQAPSLVLSGGFYFKPDVCGRFQNKGPWTWVDHLRNHAKIEIPSRELEKFRNRVLELPDPPELAWPETLRLKEVRVAPQPMLRATRSQYRENHLTLAISFAYENAAFAASDTKPRVIAGDAIIVRDPEAEEVAAARLFELGAQRGYDGPVISPRKFIPMAQVLIVAGWKIEAEGVRLHNPGGFRLAVVSGMDWFDLEGGVDYGEETVPLPKLLEAVRRGQTYVTLGDGSRGLLLEDWVKRMGFMLDAGEVHDDAVRYRPSQALLLDALLAAQEGATCDETFRRLRSKLSTFDGIRPMNPPGGFHGALRPYQREGIGWIAFLREFAFGGCLADDMGLGKTVQALCVLLARRKEKGGPSLAVVPRSLVFNWKSEAARFTPELRVMDQTQPARIKDTTCFADFDLILITYGTLRRDAALLKDFQFDYVILDEAQAIKNDATATAKAARLLKARHRLGLSGTPIENHLGELWSLFEFLNPGLLGRSAAFKRAFGKSNGHDAENRKLLGRMLRPFILRRTKGQVAPELPGKTEQSLHFELEKEERRRYDELRRYFQKEFLSGNGDLSPREKFRALEALLRLRQAACHPGLLDPKLREETSSKLDLLMKRLGEVMDEGHKALVFSQFTSFLALVRARVDRLGVPYEYLDGQTRDREARVTRFQGDPACPLFLISLKAGGQGLNLTAADYVFLLDPWWNPAVESQAIDRTHRIGQSRPVFAFRLVAKNTVEEKVLELQQKKRDLADAIITQDNASLRNLTRQDLALLLS